MSARTPDAGVPEPAEARRDRAPAQALEAHPTVDTSEREPVFLRAGRNGAFIRLSESAARLLQEVERGATFEELAERITPQGADRLSASDVEAAYRRLAARIAAIEAKSVAPRGSLWFRRRLLSGPLVARIAGGCTWMFHPVAVAVFAGGMLVAALATLHAGVHARPEDFWPGYGLFLASLVAHELGHASACARFGAAPSDIGVGLYVIYPVFYSDVTAAWTLKRWQRVVVDVGGCYFQLIVGSVYALAAAVSGWEPLRVALGLIAGSCVFSLNPILKFDGYWVVADALGVTNLAQQPRRILRHALARLRGQPVKGLPWSAPVTWVLCGYSVVSFGFWAWFIGKVAPALVPQAMHSGAVLVSLVEGLTQAPPWPRAQLLEESLAAAYVLLFAGLMFARLARVPLSLYRRGRAWRQERRAAAPRQAVG